MKLSDADIHARLASAPGWAHQGDAIVRHFTFAAFPDAIAFVTRLAFDAQAADHHPDLTVSYKKVTVSWSTHDAGGVTEKDVKGVHETDRIASRFESAKA